VLDGVATVGTPWKGPTAVGADEAGGVTVDGHVVPAVPWESAGDATVGVLLPAALTTGFRTFVIGAVPWPVEPTTGATTPLSAVVTGATTPLSAVVAGATTPLSAVVA
jgi:hypothetical protein